MWRARRAAQKKTPGGFRTLGAEPSRKMHAMEEDLDDFQRTARDHWIADSMLSSD
jgi:hypothetical protein